MTATVTDSIGTSPSTNSIEVLIANHMSGLDVPDQEARDGQPFSTPADVDGGIPPLSYEWTKDDGSKAFQPLVPPQSGTGAQTFQLNPATFADAGTYQVEVNDSGSDPALTDTFVLTVVEGLPVGGGLGLGLLAAMSAVGGALALRRRRK